MTLFVALVGVGTFGLITYDYVVHESRVAEMLERYRPLGSITGSSTSRSNVEPMHRGPETVRPHRKLDAA